MRLDRSFLALFVVSFLSGAGPVAGNEVEQGEGLSEQDESAENVVISAFWREAREVLLDGIELSPSQNEEMLEIIRRGQLERSRFRELRKAKLEAEKSGDEEAESETSAELLSLKAKLKPRGRIDQMRDILTPEQQVMFDRSRSLWRDSLLAQELERQGKARRGPSRAPQEKVEGDQ